MEKSGVILSVFLLLVVIGVVATSPPSGYQIGGSNFFKDRSAPQLSVSQAPLNPTVGQTITFTAKASDSTKVRLIQIYVDSSLKKNCFPNSAIGSCVFTTDKLSAGTHTYYAAALDVRGNRAREPKTGAKSFEVSGDKSNVSITASTPPRGKGTQFGTTGGGENIEDPYGLGRLYIDPASGSALSRTYTCTAFGSHVVFSHITISGKGGLAYNVDYAFSPYSLRWDGKYNINNPGEVVPQGDYKLVADCFGKKLEESIYVDNQQTKTSDKQTGTKDQTSLTIFDKTTILGATKIYFWGRPGGVLCGASVVMRAYDSSGKEIPGTYQKTGRTDTHTYAGKEFALNKDIKKIVGNVEGDGDWTTNDCTLIDDFGAVVTYTGESSGGTPTLKISVDTDKTEIPVNAGANLTASTYPLAADLTKIYVDGKTVQECSNVGLPDYAKITVCRFIFYATSSDVGVHSYYATAKDSAGNVVSSDTKSFTVVSGGTQTYDFYVGVTSGSGYGSGKITSSDGKISCGIDCYEKYGTGSKVTLTATADSGSTFSSWSGCTSSTNTCTVTVDSEKKITAAFVTKPPTSDSVQLAVSKSGTGSGRIYSVPAGIDCGLKCTANFAKGASVRLNAVPDGGNTLTSWGGACSSAGTSLSCTLTTDGAKSVSASFAGPVGDKTPPTVSASHDILNPQPTQAVTIVATAFDDSGKTPSLALFVDSSAVAARCYIIENTRICEYKKTYASGTHNYYATATDSSGNIGRYPSAGARSFTVGSGVTDKTAPTVSAYTTPASPKVGETVVYTTSASDDVLLKEIQIYVDGHLVQKCTPVNTKTGAICEFRISYLSPGAHTFMAKAEDTSGNVRWDPSSSTTKSVSVTAVAGAGEGVEVALPFPINAWGYYNRYGDCSSQEVNRAWADAFCKAKGYAGTISGDACYQEPVGGRYSVAGTPQSPKQGDYKGQGLAFTKVRCTYATAVPAGTGTS